jgi:hypothetical protein
MSLTDIAIRSAKPREKAFKLFDEKGLYLLVNRSGKYWRMDYRFRRRRKTMALGVYPEVQLAQARERREGARRLLDENIDPSRHKRDTRHLVDDGSRASFEKMAREWFAKNAFLGRRFAARASFPISLSPSPWAKILVGGCKLVR